MHPYLISPAGSQEAAHYQAIEVSDAQERALDRLRQQVRQDVKDGEPQTCNAFAAHCSTFFDRDVAYAFTLARLQGDDALLQQAQADLDKHIATELDEFIDQEAVARRARLLAQAEAIALEAVCA